MRVEPLHNPNCSEAVFRFYTLEPEKIQAILQALADEIYRNDPYYGHQKIPLFERAEDYQTVVKWREEQVGDTTIRVPRYENVLLRACAGMGDPECVITIERDKGAFVLNIGNNDISENTTGWVEKVMAMGIRVEEAERSPSLARKYARDCTCGITFFPEDYPGLIKEEA